jgi:hypothetical protein
VEAARGPIGPVPDDQAMEVQPAEKIGYLVAAFLVVAGPRPSPGLDC